MDSPALWAAIESHGAVVVAEDDWWGSRAAGRDIDTTIDPVRAIFEKYYFDAPSPRVFPAEISDAWFHNKASEVDGAIFFICRKKTMCWAGITYACEITWANVPFHI